MSSSRMTAISVGALFLISYTGFIIGTALVAPSLDPATDLAAIQSNEQQLVAGALLLFVNMAAIIGIGALLFPMLKAHGEGIALWYVGFRILEAAAYAVAIVSTLSLVAVSGASAASATASANAEALRGLALAQNDGARIMATVAFVVAAPVLYVLLYRSKLVPRFISVWGLVAVAMLVLANVLGIDVTAGFQPAALLYVPIALNELFLAGWLIIRGFGEAATRRAVPQPAVA